MTTRFENPREWRQAAIPAGTEYRKVKTFNGNTGKCVSIEYTIAPDKDLEDMVSVSYGYFTETYRGIRVNQAD